MLRHLERQKGEVRQERAFKRFVRDYGTHYLSSAFMGAKVATVTFHDSGERLKFGRSRLINCSEQFARKEFDLEPGSGGSGGGDDDDDMGGGGDDSKEDEEEKSDDEEEDYDYEDYDFGERRSFR